MFFDRMMQSSRPWAVGLALAGVALIGLGSSGLAQDPKPKTPRADDPASRALLEQVSKAYRSLASYSDQGEFVIAMSLGGKVHKQARPLKLAFARPNKVDLDTGVARLNSDGKTLTVSVESLKRYTTAPAPESLDINTFREGPIGAVLFGGPAAAPMFVLLNLVTGTNPDVMVDQMGGSIQPAPAPAGGGKGEGSAILINLTEGPDLLLTVDPSTKLLSGVELKIDPKQLAKSAPPGQTLSIDQFGWTAGPVSTQAPKDQVFAFVAPKGFTHVDSLKAQPGAGQAPKHAIEEKIGKPAPEFSLTLLDGPGKTRTITNAELAGKVVLIDFWATWCGPCLIELPEIQKLIEAYASSKKDVVIVALSQDSEPTELSETRKLVEKTLNDKKLNLTGSPVGQIGLDPSNSVGTAFQVEGYPTLVIIDGKGIVQSAHVGYNPETAEPLHKSLAKEIDALLEGKSLAAPHAGAEKDPKKVEAKK